MAAIDVYNASNNDSFQGICLSLALTTAQHVIANDEGYDQSAPSREFSINLWRGDAKITQKQIALQVLRNATIAGAVGAFLVSGDLTTLDSDIDWQIKQVWPDLIAIG